MSLQFRFICYILYYLSNENSEFDFPQGKIETGIPKTDAHLEKGSAQPSTNVIQPERPDLTDIRDRLKNTRSENPQPFNPVYSKPTDDQRDEIDRKIAYLIRGGAKSRLSRFLFRDRVRNYVDEVVDTYQTHARAVLEKYEGHLDFHDPIRSVIREGDVAQNRRYLIHLPKRKMILINITEHILEHL